jgi:hypothetical protein
MLKIYEYQNSTKLLVFISSLGFMTTDHFSWSIGYCIHRITKLISLIVTISALFALNFQLMMILLICHTSLLVFDWYLWTCCYFVLSSVGRAAWFDVAYQSLCSINTSNLLSICYYIRKLVSFDLFNSFIHKCEEFV